MCDMALDDLIIDEYYGIVAAPAAWGGEDLFTHWDVGGEHELGFADHPAWESIAEQLTDRKNADMAAAAALRQRRIDDWENLIKDVAAGHELAKDRFNAILLMSKATGRPTPASLKPLEWTPLNSPMELVAAVRSRWFVNRYSPGSEYTFPAKPGRCEGCGERMYSMWRYDYERVEVCSTKCRTTRDNARRAETRRSRSKGPEFNDCARCGKTFSSRRKDAKTCSPACRKALSRL